MISTKHIRRIYDKSKQNAVAAVNDISLELPEKGMVAVFGKSGCGKTTLLNLIGGLDRPDGGTVSVCGEEMKIGSDELRNRCVGYIFQNYNLNRDVTVFENVAAALRLCGMSDESEITRRVNIALRCVGMLNYSRRRPDTLSGGQQQRVAIARAIVKNPPVILADEPTGNLDENNTIMIMDMLKSISREHLVLIVTHEAHLVDAYCDRVIEIVDGRVVCDRENENAEGRTKRNSNDIYLGELSKTVSETPNATVEYYGEPTEKLRLCIVNVNGKLYLKSLTPSLRVIDESSEITLHDGVFEELPATGRSGAVIDTHELGVPDGSSYGRLFRLRSSIAGSFGDLFRRKSKRRTKLLKFTLFFLAVFTVFTVSGLSNGLRVLLESYESMDPDVYYVRVRENTDVSAISNGVGSNGIEWARYMPEHYFLSASGGGYVRMKTDQFVTATAGQLYCNSVILDESLCKDKEVIAGNIDDMNAGAVVLSSASADGLLASGRTGLYENYDDLIGKELILGLGTYSREYVICSVVEDKTRSVYADSLTAAASSLTSVGVSLYPASFVESDIAVKEGEAFLLEGSYTGESVNIFGKKYNVVRREDVSSSWFGQEYRDYVLYQCSEQLEPFEVFSLKYDDKVTAVYDWLFDYYFRYSLEYCRSIPTNDPLIWAGGDSGDILWLISVLEREKMFDTLGVDAETVYEMYLYVSQFGDLPSSANENWVEFSKKSRAGELSQMLEEYRSYVLDHSSGYCSFALSDGEYANLAYGSGENSAAALGNSDYYVGIAMAVYTDGSKEAAQFLASAFGGNLMDKKDVFNEQIRYEQVDFIALLTAIGVMLALICLCVYFMMRSTLMNRIKEVGILRAIGVSSKNLVFRFSVETLVLVICTVGLGLLLSIFAITWSSGGIGSFTVFYLPWWLSVLTSVIVVAVCFGSGILPLLGLLRKTPSAILAKYDI